jgi:hypothetical protein
MPDEQDFDSTTETQDIEDVAGDEFEGEEEFEDDSGGEEGNPWAWAEGLDPEDVAKTYQKFTQKTQNLSTQEREVQRMRDELAPLNKLRDQLEQDPGLVMAIERYFATQGQDPQSELAEVKQELANVKTSLVIDKEMADVARWVRKEGLPAFDEDELLEYATSNRILNLKAAYRDMNFDRVQNLKAEQLTEDIKRGRGAAVPKTRRADKSGPKKFTEDDIANMSEDEFKKNFAEIYESF